MDIKLAKETAIKAIREAGDILMLGLYKEKKVSFKGRGDIVTHVDLESEKFILDLIRKNFPDHSILSEESGFTDKESEYIWVLDPIDGTMNYYHGFDTFCIGLCLLKNDELVISAIYNPVRDQFYFAQKGKGATLNGEIIKVSNMSMENSIIATHLSSKKDKRDRIIYKLEKICSAGMHIRMLGSSLSAITHIASGSLDAFFSVDKTNPWDILPGALFVQEAGGKVTDIKGNKIGINSSSVLATNGKLHEKILSLLKDI